MDCSLERNIILNEIKNVSLKDLMKHDTCNSYLSSLRFSYDYVAKCIKGSS